MQFALFPLISVWSAAVVVKAIRCLSNDARYTFAMWDGGMIRMGQSLTPTGAAVKIGTAIALGATSMVCIAGVARPYMLYALVGIAIISLVCDFSFADR